MEVTVNIVRDLLPVYMAGEASSDTRAAVESFLERDPALREIVDGAAAWPAPPVELPPDLEARTLRRTRRLLNRKNLILAAALGLTFASQLVSPLWLADVCMLLGLAAWAAFIYVCRLLSATGLEAPRSWGPRFVWGIGGALLGMAMGHLVQLQSGWHRALYDLPGITFGLALWIGEKYRQISTSGELSRPMSLFGDGR